MLSDLRNLEDPTAKVVSTMEETQKSASIYVSATEKELAKPLPLHNRLHRNRRVFPIFNDGGVKEVEVSHI